MTEPGASRPVAKARRRHRSLYRTVLSLGIAAVVAAWLPFSSFYVTAIPQRATTVTAIRAPHASAGATRVVTTASGATRVVPVNGSPVAAGTPVFVSSRDS